MIDPSFEEVGYGPGLAFPDPILGEEGFDNRNYVSVGDYILITRRLGRDGHHDFYGLWGVYQLLPDDTIIQTDNGQFAGGTGVANTVFLATDLDYNQWEFLTLQETSTHNWMLLVSGTRVQKQFSLRIVGIEKASGRLVKADGSYGFTELSDALVVSFPEYYLNSNAPFAAVLGQRIVVTLVTDTGTHYGINRWTFDWDAVTRVIVLNEDHGAFPLLDYTNGTAYEIFQGPGSSSDGTHLVSEYGGYTGGDDLGDGGLIVVVDDDGQVAVDEYSLPNGASLLYGHFYLLDRGNMLLTGEGDDILPYSVVFDITGGSPVVQGSAKASDVEIENFWFRVPPFDSDAQMIASVFASDFTHTVENPAGLTAVWSNLDGSLVSEITVTTDHVEPQGPDLQSPYETTNIETLIGPIGSGRYVLVSEHKTDDITSVWDGTFDMVVLEIGHSQLLFDFGTGPSTRRFSFE